MKIFTQLIGFVFIQYFAHLWIILFVYRETVFYIIKTIYTTIKHPLISQCGKVAGLDLITQSAIVISKDIFFVIYERYRTPH